MKSVFKVSIAALVIAVGTALAHHSSAGFSEGSKVVSGTIKDFQFRNPHSWIQVNVADASGNVTEWSVEWGSPNQLGREGIRPSTFPAGAQVSIRLRPDLTGHPIGIFVGAKLSDGKTVGKWSEE
ncbi:MAG TPA: DUF6152 family protein [Bryobacteraceae bacterium]|jgi:hypothetical protein|nr:DUF6152 family protein [Bryobacteraceae bacterium]